jgi:hypothetical protein
MAGHSELCGHALRFIFQDQFRAEWVNHTDEVIAVSQRLYRNKSTAVLERAARSIRSCRSRSMILSGRIGQRRPVRVKSLCYEETMQTACLRLMERNCWLRSLDEVEIVFSTGAL